jgi:hypothetical protein
MSTVHTEYGPGRIIAQETVRGRTRFKVAGQGFEVWLDQTKLGGYETPAEGVDFSAPHWEGHNLDDGVTYPEPHAPLSDDEYAEYADPRGHLDRGRMRQHPDYLSDDDPDARFARRRQAGYAEDEMRGLTRGDYEGYDEEYDPSGEYGGLARDPGLSFDDDPDGRFAKRRRVAGPGDDYADSELSGLSRGGLEGYDDEYDPRGEYQGLARDPGLSFDDDPDGRYARKRTAGDPGIHMVRGAPGGVSLGDFYEDEHGNLSEDDPYAEVDHPEHFTNLRDQFSGYDDDDPARYSNRQRALGKGEAHLAWAPLDDDNSTELPYNPRPQHDAVTSGSGDDNSSTIQPIHHIDADERLRSSDSISFDDADGDYDDEPGPNPDLFARQAGVPSPNMVKGLGQQALDAIGVGNKVNLNDMHDRLRDTVRNKVIERTNNPEMADKAVKGMDGGLEGGSAAGAVAAGEYAVGRTLDKLDPGDHSGWGRAIHQASPAALLAPALRTLAPMAIDTLMNHGGGHEGGGPQGPGLLSEALDGTDSGSGWDDAMHEASKSLSELFPPSTWDESDRSQNMYAPDGSTWDEYDERHPPVHEGSYRPAGLDDRYIDLTASVDYWNDPAAQFRHDPDAYINRIGHVMDEGLNPRFAEYMDLVEGDASVRTAAWKDVRQKAMRLKTSGAVHVKDIAPSRIMASVDGDHGTYDVTILKGASIGGLTANSISNWHCSCEWGRWAFRRKFTFVGRLCSHGYAAYLTMQSSAMKGQRPTRRGPSDAIIVNRPAKDRYLPTFTYAAGRRTADALQNGPERLTPELVVSDTDDAHMFLDVTKDERDDVGPDDVVSNTDIVHFARLMRHCEINEQPYPRQLVAFLSRYADCDDPSDDTQADYKADDADDANQYLEQIRSDADRKQENDFGSMAERVHDIQDAVEEARAHGADADRFVAMVKKSWSWDDEVTTNEDGSKTVTQDGKTRTISVDEQRNPAGTPLNYYQENYGAGDNVKGNAPGEGPSNTPIQGPGLGYYGPADNIKGQAPNPGVQAPNPGVQAPNPGQATLTSGPGGAASANAAAGPYTAPGGGQTSGTIADGGVAGAENGNNAAITKNMLDADGNYTVGKGDTWSDIAQRTTGDMNNYQKMFDQQKGGAGGNIDSLAEGTKINLKDFANDTGNSGVSGDLTNPAGGGADGNIGTVDTTGLAQNVSATNAADGAALGLNAGTSIGVDTSAADKAGAPPAAATPGADAASAVPPPTTPKAPEPVATPTPTAGSTAQGARHSAKAWLRWAAEGDGSAAPATDTAEPATDTASPGAAPATNPATTPGSPSKSETYDPQNPAELEQQSVSAANPGTQAGGSNTGLPDMGMGMSGSGMGDIGSMIGQGVGVASDIASGIGGMMGGGGLASGIGGLASGVGSAISGIFSSKQDMEDWRRYAYPADGGDDFDPETLPHIPFAGSGNPGPLEFSTSEEYADKARKKMDDVTDLGDGDLTESMGDWQKQGSYDEATDDSSDIVRRFQAHLGETALGAGAGQSAGRFDDFSSAAAGFLRTAGRNYSLAEQSELIREGDKGGAGNLRSLDLAGTHYEDMHTLGW